MKIRNVDPQRIISIVEAISFGFNSFEKVCEFVFDKQHSKISGGDKNHISRGISSTEQLGMLSSSVNDIKNATFELKNIQNSIPQTWKEEDKIVFFKNSIQAFQPFLRYYDFISKGFSHSSAASKTSSIFEISPPLSGENNVFKRWGVFSGIFDDSGEIKAELKESPIKQKTEFFIEAQGLNDDLRCRKFILDWVGEDSFNFIDEDIKSDLIKALKCYDSDPDSSIKHSGNALEDHIKLIAKNRGVLLNSSNGKPLSTIGAMVQKLREVKVLADHHTNTLKGLEVFLSADVFHGLNAFRIMPSHGKNLEAKQRWSLSSEIALIVVLELILAIKSTYYYAIKKKLYY